MLSDTAKIILEMMEADVELIDFKDITLWAGIHLAPGESIEVERKVVLRLTGRER